MIPSAKLRRSNRRKRNIFQSDGINKGLILNPAIQQCYEYGKWQGSCNAVNAGEAPAKLNISAPAPEWAVSLTALKEEHR